MSNLNLRSTAVRSLKHSVVLHRISRYSSFKAFEKRILVATDIFGRGIDVERVNVVINYVGDSSLFAVIVL